MHDIQSFIFNLKIKKYIRQVVRLELTTATALRLYQSAGGGRMMPVLVGVHVLAVVRERASGSEGRSRSAGSTPHFSRTARRGARRQTRKKKPRHGEIAPRASPRAGPGRRAGLEHAHAHAAERCLAVPPQQPRTRLGSEFSPSSF